MTGHFEKGVWVEEPSWIIITYPQIQQQFNYPDVPTQLSIITEKCAWLERQLMAMDKKIDSLVWELRWKK